MPINFTTGIDDNARTYGRKGHIDYRGIGGLDPGSPTIISSNQKKLIKKTPKKNPDYDKHGKPTWAYIKKGKKRKPVKPRDNLADNMTK